MHTALLKNKHVTNKIDAIKADVIAQITAEDEEISEGKIVDIFTALESQIVRGRIIAGEPRIDGRTVDTVRALDICTGVLPRTHGSAIFTRGETQALAVATLGTERDAQIIDELTGERQDHFLFHYNFPPYSVGETVRFSDFRHNTHYIREFCKAWHNCSDTTFC